MPRLIFFAVLLLTAAACDRQDGESYGYVATLGTDTTSVERITRTGNRIIGDAVGRSPVVVRRQWEATLAPDGSLRSWTMRTHIPNAAEGATDLHHDVILDDSTVRLIRRTGSDTTDVTYVRAYPVIVPWNAFVYGTWDMLFRATRESPDSARIGQYFFEGWAEGSIGFAYVRRLGGDSVDIRSTGLSGAGVAHLDSAGGLVSYSGQGTTYLQEVRRIDDAIDIDAIATRFAEEERTRGVARSLSPRDTSRADIGGTALTIDYSRPHARGRTLVGGIIPLGRVWRTGANAATQLTLSGPAIVGGVPLDSGTYTLWTLPDGSGVQLIINRQAGQWGTQYGAAHDIARVPMQVDTTDGNVEQFTIRIDTAADSPRLVMEWGTFRWSVPVAARD